MDLNRLDRVRIVELIEIEAVKGQGTEKDPIRRVKSYWTKDGKIIAEIEDTNELTFGHR